MRFLNIQSSLKSKIRFYELRCYCSTREMYEEMSEEDEIMKIRDKSRMPPHLKTIFLKGIPVENPNPKAAPRRNKIEYQRKLYARFGELSGVNPGIMWPSKESLKDTIAYEEKFYPPLSELMAKAEAKMALEIETIRKRDEEIQMNLKKVEQARKEMLKRISDQEEKVKLQQAKKEKLIQEVKEFLGYAIEPKDPRFKELLEAKEKEQKKIEREAKKSERQKKLMARLTEAAALARSKASAKSTPDTSASEASSETFKEDN